MQMNPSAPLLLVLLPVIMASGGAQTLPFAVGERHNGGKFQGFMVEGAVAF